ncbi:hypothetical protein [Pedobacter arcticus]|uniref:hypothetical protein n=1 Tax=Pedobacter arcticus TaxID=752140 RepID=UPI0002E54D2C|nr:hypothetical protein [Pedobacter arcticus]
MAKLLKDGENIEAERTGRIGGLPYQGLAWYRKHLKFESNEKFKSTSLEFDGL